MFMLRVVVMALVTSVKNLTCLAWLTAVKWLFLVVYLGSDRLLHLYLRKNGVDLKP